MADEVSYFSRFTVKFVEIVAAGMATAVSGYLIAHLGGFWSSPTPAPVVAAPSTSAASVNQPTPPSHPVPATSPSQPFQAAPASQPVQATPPSQPVSPAPPVSADASEPRPVPVQESAPSAKPAARTTGNGAPARKRGSPDTGTAESKPRDAAEKLRDAAEGKPRETAEKPRDAADSKPHEPAEKPREATEAEQAARLGVSRGPGARCAGECCREPASNVRVAASPDRYSPASACGRRAAPAGRRAFRDGRCLGPACRESSAAAGGCGAGGSAQARPAARSRDKITAGCRR